ncbi:MAG TPA: GDP-L-fucose synthase [Dehalococcoidia bacterium]|nr:GDP-L-fucose synthase [Dehalococcoidia bacterium]
MEKDSRIYIAGHTGLLGSALLRKCHENSYTNVITRTHGDLDLCDAAATEAFFAQEQPEYVFLAAAKVGGILANLNYPANFIYPNLMIETSVIEAARRHGVKRLLFFGGTCAYPRECPQPMREEYLLTGPVEPSSEAYAIAKIAGMKLCQAYNAQYGTEFLSIIPATLYGPNDNFDFESGHVLSALVRRFHEANVSAKPGSEPDPVAIWGTGAPRREFLYVDDAAEACILLANLSSDALSSLFHPPAYVINVGSGSDVTIAELAVLVRSVVGFSGGMVFDTTKPDGTPRKLLDSSAFYRIGWKPQVSLEEGIRRTYELYRNKVQQPELSQMKL